jgi:hypothetical protein
MSDSSEFLDMGRSLWREDGSVVYKCPWSSLARVRVPWDSWRYFTVSDSILPFSSPPTTCRVTVEVFDPASTLLRQSVSQLYYDRRSVGQSVLVSSPHLGLMTRFLLLSDNCGFVDMGRPLWREDGSVVYNCCCLRQRSHSQVRVPRGSWPHFTVSDLRLPQPKGPGSCIYIPQEQGGPVIPPGIGLNNHTPAIELRVLINLGADRKQNTPLNGSSVVICVSAVTGTFTEPLSGNGLFRPSGFPTYSSCKRASTLQQPCVSKPLSNNGLFRVATGMRVYRTVV